MLNNTQFYSINTYKMWHILWLGKEVREALQEEKLDQNISQFVVKLQLRARVWVECPRMCYVMPLREVNVGIVI